MKRFLVLIFVICCMSGVVYGEGGEVAEEGPVEKAQKKADLAKSDAEKLSRDAENKKEEAKDAQRDADEAAEALKAAGDDPDPALVQKAADTKSNVEDLDAQAKRLSKDASDKADEAVALQKDADLLKSQYKSAGPEPEQEPEAEKSWFDNLKDFAKNLIGFSPDEVAIRRIPKTVESELGKISRSNATIVRVLGEAVPGKSVEGFSPKQIRDFMNKEGVSKGIQFVVESHLSQIDMSERFITYSKNRSARLEKQISADKAKGPVDKPSVVEPPDSSGFNLG